MAGLAPLNDDIAGHQVPGMANAIDDEPLDFDIILHAGPPDQDQAAVQNIGFLAQNNLPALDVVQEGFEHDVDPMQQGPGGADALQIDFGHQGHAEEDDLVLNLELPQHPFPGFPGDWLVASNAIQQVVSFLRDDHPVYATPPAGPGQAMALYAALTQYVIAHGLPFNPPAHPIALPQDVPPLNGFLGLVGLLNDVDEGPEPGPDVQEDEFADFGEPQEDDDIVLEAQFGQVDQVVDEVGDGPALFLQPVPLPDVEPVLQPALVAGHDHVLIPAPAQDAAVVAQGVEDAAPMNVPADAPPPSVPAPDAAPMGEEHGEANQPDPGPAAGNVDLAHGHIPHIPAQEVHGLPEPPEPGARDDADNDIIEAPIPVPLFIAGGVTVLDPSTSFAGLDQPVSLEAEAREAFSSLCARFALPESLSSLTTVLAEANRRLEDLDKRANLRRSNRVDSEGSPAEGSGTVKQLRGHKVGKIVARRIRGVVNSWKRRDTVSPPSIKSQAHAHSTVLV